MRNTRKPTKQEMLLIQEKRRKVIDELVFEYATGKISLYGALLRANCRGFVHGRAHELKMEREP